jgi:hypothetical protein
VEEYMNERIKQFAEEAGFPEWSNHAIEFELEQFAELIVRECINREALLGAIARGWCSEKNSHKTMDSDLAVAIFDEVEQHIRQQFGIK